MMGYERSVSGESGRIPSFRETPPVSGPLPIKTYFKRKLERPWVARRLRHEVIGLMRHAEKLREAAVDPPNEFAVSLQNARTAVHGLRTELDLWGLLEVRSDRPGANIEALLELDITEELARHGIT